MDEAQVAELLTRLERRHDERHTEVMSAITDLRAYVERIETEANDMMKGLTDPGELLKKFIG